MIQRETYIPNDVVAVDFSAQSGHPMGTLAPEYGIIVRHCMIDDTYEIDLGSGMNAEYVPYEWILGQLEGPDDEELDRDHDDDCCCIYCIPGF